MSLVRALNGLLLLDKPAGCTSNRVLQQVRKLYGAKKAGHTGSLDPSATGMLPVCFGEATKLCAYMLDADKTYRVSGLFGVTTDTEDADGTVLNCCEVPLINEAQMLEVVNSFTGEQLQRPPVYSAIKRNGVRSYKLAREGKTVELEPRRINVKTIELTEFSGDRFTLELCVSKGTYIRSIVRDLGERFGCGAHVTALRRLSVSPFDRKNMVSLEQIESADNADELLLATDEVIADWPSVSIDDESARRFQNGSKPAHEGIDSPETLLRVYNPANIFLGLGRVASGRLETVRLIHGQTAVPAAGQKSDQKSDQSSSQNSEQVQKQPVGHNESCIAIGQTQ